MQNKQNGRKKNGPKCTKDIYCQFLVAAQADFTATGMEDGFRESAAALSHDAVTRWQKKVKLTPAQLWPEVEPLVVKDSVKDPRAVIPLLAMRTAWAFRRNNTSGEVLAYARSTTFSSSTMFVLVTHSGWQERLVLFFGGYTSTFNMRRKDNPGYATAVVDMMFVSKNIKIVSRDVPDVDISDHLPLVVSLRI